MRHLTPKEQSQFREDYRDKEREIQKYIAVYLSALVVVTGWVVGPQSKPFIVMLLGNNGFNLCGFLAIIAVNVIFSCFLTYKSIIIHEIMQFVYYLAPSDSAFLQWEGWRRSPQSATKKVRVGYTATISALPIAVSFMLLFIVGYFARQNASDLSRLLTTAVGQPASAVASGEIAGYVHKSALIYARVAFVVVIIFHWVPLRLFYVNVKPVAEKWNELKALRPEVPTFDSLTPYVFDPQPSPAELSAKKGDSGASALEVVFKSSNGKGRPLLGFLTLIGLSWLLSRISPTKGNSGS